MPASSIATTRNGCARRATRGINQLPSAMPPMKAHNSTATEIAEAPTTN